MGIHTRVLLRGAQVESRKEERSRYREEAKAGACSQFSLGLMEVGGPPCSSVTPWTVPK